LGFVEIKQGPQEVFPAPVKAKNSRGDQGGLYQREKDTAENSKFIAAVDHGALIQFYGNAPEKLDHHKDEKGLASPLGHYQGQIGIYPAQFKEKDELGNHDHLVGQHEGKEHTGVPEFVSPELNPRKPVGRQGRHEHRAQGGKAGNNKGINLEGSKTGETVVPPAPDVIPEGKIFREQRNSTEYLLCGLEGTEGHPEQGIEHEDADEEHQPVKHNSGPYVLDL
jgi:hypothetical protein